MNDRRVAYFSMEIALETNMPTYSGGLGVLSGDTLRAAADQKLPMVGVTLLHRKGYFYQRLTDQGIQHEEPVEWPVNDFVEEMPARTSVPIENRTVTVRAWKYSLTGMSGYEIPVYLLDTDLPDNTEWDRSLTDHLYGGDSHYRLSQEAVLGIGGLRLLGELGHRSIERYHMNEGHAALLTGGLLERELNAAGTDRISGEMIESVRRQAVFTTHTPVPAGHDKFSWNLADQVLGGFMKYLRPVLEDADELNMTYLALRMSHYVNGVARRHGEVSRDMFRGYEIDSITNGVHAPTWIGPAFQQLFDRYITGWRADNVRLRYAGSIPRSEIWSAHARAKSKLIRYVNRHTNAGMDTDVFTLGYARRATRYKRPDMLIGDPERLNAIARDRGPIQVIYAGKAHPKDQEGKHLIQQIFETRGRLSSSVRLCYLENYDMDLGQLLTAGVDLWINTPLPPNEASGTSGMKAAMNGVPSLSTLDGWWIEGHLEGTTGWAVGNREAGDDRSDRDDLYLKLDERIVPMFYKHRERYSDIMRNCVALNGSFFTTERMVREYATNAYHLQAAAHEPTAP